MSSSRAVATPPGAHSTGTALTGMFIFMASWAMLFLGLFFAYALVRQHAPEWPPADLPPLPLALPLFATVCLAASSLFLQRAANRKNAATTAVHLPAIVAGVLGAGFLACQIVVWRRLIEQGLVPSTGTYASVFFTLTIFHALHVAVGLVAIAYLSLASTQKSSPITYRLWTLYWHGVGIVWAVMFVVVYLV